VIVELCSGQGSNNSGVAKRHIVAGKTGVFSRSRRELCLFIKSVSSCCVLL
jgi:hypothetical protein